MDDLTGLDWTASDPNTRPPKLPPMNPVSHYPSLRPTPPLSGRSTPSSIQNPFKPPVALVPRSNSSTPANDSFANLVAFNAPQASKNLSLEEQKRALEEKRAREQGQQKKQSDIKIGGHEGDFWNRLGNGSVTPNPTPAPPSYTGTDEYGGQKLSNTINKPFAALNGTPSEVNNRTFNGDVDLLSVFDSLPVDKTNSLNQISKNTRDAQVTGADWQKPKTYSLPSSQMPKAARQSHQELPNDDPFGLGAMETTESAQFKDAGEPSDDDDDDILGLLGRPVSDFPAPMAKEAPAEPINTGFFDPMDHAIAELVDMGFSAEKSKEALESTESGIDVQAAVGWLLTQAHEDSKSSRGQQRPKKLDLHEASQHRRLSVSSQSPDEDMARPAWMREAVLPTNELSRQNSRSPVNGEKDPGKYAAELGNNLFKTANTLWKTGTKKLNQAVSELNSDSDSSQPKWMRDSQTKSEARRSRPQVREKTTDGRIIEPGDIGPRRSKDRAPEVTDEALMLESGDNRPPPRKPPRQLKEVPPPWSSDSSRDHSPTASKPKESNLLQPRFLRKPIISDAKTKLSRQAIEEQSSNAYISPARRKKPAPEPPSPEPNLLFEESPASSKPLPSAINPKPPTSSTANIQAQSSEPANPQPRSIPQISPSALQISATNRHEGTSAFKRGDYALATTLYTTALSALPPKHPLTVVILTNRALSHLKTGDPKSAVADTKSALTLIGPSQGILESIDLGDEGSKDMKEFWTKAMTRQAEALEQLERWSDAAALWRSCVESGAGGAVSRAGRVRCEKAAAGPSLSIQASKPAPPKKTPSKPIHKPLALADLSGQNDQVSAEAVIRLRQANIEAERLDDEKFALVDQVNERLVQWREGKEGNLRALLASLENVLWDGAGWKKVGMGELIAPGKVKIAYMKGIARVHPDKVRFSYFSVPRINHDLWASIRRRIVDGFFLLT